jgi:hypothetical protein
MSSGTAKNGVIWQILSGKSLEFKVRVDDEIITEHQWNAMNLDCAIQAARLAEIKPNGKLVTFYEEAEELSEWVTLGACAQINRESLVESCDKLGS